jgi:hypothetical protein
VGERGEAICAVERATGRIPGILKLGFPAGEIIVQLAPAVHLRGQEMSLRDIAARLVIVTGKKKGQHPSPATVMRMLRPADQMR